jgi:hypothetical protein
VKTKQPITVSDGRVFYGRYPRTTERKLLEHRLSDELAVRLRGTTEAKLPYGRADVLTSTTVFEVEPAAQWRHGVRQVLAYAAQTGCTPAVALFGEASHPEVLRTYLRLRDNRPAVELWWWYGEGWRRVSNRRGCHATTATS